MNNLNFTRGPGDNSEAFWAMKQWVLEHRVEAGLYPMVLCISNETFWVNFEFGGAQVG